MRRKIEAATIIQTWWRRLVKKPIPPPRAECVLARARKPSTSLQVKVDPSLEVKSLEAKSLEVKALEAKALEVKSLEAKALEVKSLEVKSLEVKSLEVKSLEVKSLEAKSLEVKSLEAKGGSKRRTFPNIPTMKATALDTKGRKRAIAALIIQLAWRVYLRRKASRAEPVTTMEGTASTPEVQYLERTGSNKSLEYSPYHGGRGLSSTGRQLIRVNKVYAIDIAQNGRESGPAGTR